MTKPAPDITIRHCTLRVTRRGGWSWGADAQTLTRRAIERLPGLLESGLAACSGSLPDDIDIVQPLSVRVPVRQQEWAALAGGAGLSAHLRARLEAAIDAAITGALPAALAAAPRQAEHPDTKSPAAPGGDATVPAPGTPASTTAQLSALWKLLSQWRADGRLLTQLAAIDEPVLQAWLETLVLAEVAARIAAPDDETVARLWQEVSALPLLMADGPARAIVRRLIFTLELKTRWATDSARTIKLLAAVSGGDASTAADAALASAYAAGVTKDANMPGIEPGKLAAAPAAIVARAGPGINDAFEVDVPCALPFLMLTPLSRAGYFTILAAALEAAHASSLAGGVALGLAHKCLAPPRFGWLRDAGALAAAAALAGRRTCENDLVLNAGRALRPQLALFDRCVADELLHSHRAEAGWLLARSNAEALVLFDEDGLAPVATGSLASLAARIAPSAGVLFLPAHVALADHLDTLDDLQIPYASDADLASRKSASSFVAPDGRRLSVSVHGGQQGRARGLAERGNALVDAALANWSAVQETRTAQRPGIDAAFETSLSLAASFALTAIAWTLWRHRARATALAAIEVFSDLDARVRVTPDQVHVVLPMGRRAWDLRNHGLLADVRDVPWLDGRVVTFGVG